VIRPDFTPESIGRLARLAEQAGIDEVWLWEDCFLRGGIAQAAAALAATETVRVGVGVIPGGAGAKTLGLARQVADGVVLDGQHTPTTVRAALDETDYPQDGARDGFSSVLYHLACAPREGGKVTLRAEADKWNVASANEFGVGGDIDDIRDGVRTYLDAGVKALALQSVGGEEDMPDFIRSGSNALIG
jgi:Luciferase-like monooxygenase